MQTYRYIVGDIRPSTNDWLIKKEYINKNKLKFPLEMS